MAAPPPPSYESVVLDGAQYRVTEHVPHASQARDPRSGYGVPDGPVARSVHLPHSDLGSSVHDDLRTPMSQGGGGYKFVITLSDPVKHGDNYTGYTLYRVSTKTTAPDYQLSPASFVLRRYSDFEWLHLTLRTKLPGVIPPSIPEKQTSKKFDNDFVQQRMEDLERFINKVANNTIMQTSSDLKLFLTEVNPTVWEGRAAWYEKGTMGNMISGMSSWFNQMAVTAEGVYFSKGIQSVIKAEDPEYLDMVDYFVNLEGRLTMIRDCVARLSRSYVTMGTLWGEMGANAVAVGAIEEENNDDFRKGVGDGLGKGFLQIGDAAASLRTPWEDHSRTMMNTLLDRLRDYLLVVGTVKEAIDERANALIEYQTACCIYDEKVHLMQQLVQKAAAGAHPSAPKTEQVRSHESEVASAAAKRDDAKHRYDEICLRMKTELPRTYATMTKDLNEAFDAFLEKHARLATSTARAWDTVLPGCGEIALMPNVQPVGELDDALTSDVMTSTYHSSLTAMGYTE